jgi:hypothetical protein
MSAKSTHRRGKRKREFNEDELRRLRYAPKHGETLDKSFQPAFLGEAKADGEKVFL